METKNAPGYSAPGYGITSTIGDLCEVQPAHPALVPSLGQSPWLYWGRACGPPALSPERRLGLPSSSLRGSASIGPAGLPSRGSTTGMIRCCAQRPHSDSQQDASMSTRSLSHLWHGLSTLLITGQPHVRAQDWVDVNSVTMADLNITLALVLSSRVACQDPACRPQTANNLPVRHAVPPQRLSCGSTVTLPQIGCDARSPREPDQRRLCLVLHRDITPPHLPTRYVPRD